ncbi:MAG: hypothetical protein GMKNLPBB_02560 [Myxococcota bacterium]|nr:hypothetical protein [Myxococcota bacterium]
MKDYLKSKLVWLGLLLLIGGAGPLIAVIIAAELGLTSDPNPNPIGLGLLAMVTFWPGVIALTTGLARVWNSKRKGGK